MDIFLFTGGPNAVGAPAVRADLPKAWRRFPRDLRIWRRGAWRAPGGPEEFETRLGPDLGFAVETLKAAPRDLGVIRTETDGLTPAHAARKTAHAVRVALLKTPGRVTGALYDGPDPDVFAARLRVAANLPDLLVYTIGEAGEGVSPLFDVRPSGAQTPRGRIRTGRVLARAAASQTARPPVQSWIWNSRQYQAWSEGVTAQTPAAIVAFPHALTSHGLFEYGFGQRYFAKRGVPVIYVRCAKSRWFQNEEALEVAAAIRNRLGPDIALTTYGASMGAYGALLLSGLLRAETALAVAPQFSIDPADVPEETRWRGSAARIGGFIHDLKAMVRPEARKIVIYDRRSPDRYQIDRMPMDESWDVLNLPYASHQILTYLAETKTLDLLLQGCPGPGPDLDKLRVAARGRRRDSGVYWRQLATHARARHPEWAAIFRDMRKGGGGR